MTGPEAIRRTATVVAGLAMLVTLAWTFVEVANCNAGVGNAVNWCDLGWIGGGFICLLIGLAWLAVIVLVAVVGWILDRLDR